MLLDIFFNTHTFPYFRPVSGLQTCTGFVIIGFMAKPVASEERLTTKDIVINNVWRENLEIEFNKIRELVKNYPYIALDTEFPGVVATPIGAFQSKNEFYYNKMRLNVNTLKPIQVGFCMMNDKGELPPGGDIWQFNLRFSLNEDMYAVESIDLLKKSGIDFARHRVDGIPMADFGALLTTSGLVVNNKVTWLTFHSCYDFGYLIKTIIVQDLPPTEKEFLEVHRILFPFSYDLKMMLKVPGGFLRGGLQTIADRLFIERIGNQHQAASDSLLTARTFFKYKERFFSDNWDKISEELCGQMHGLPGSTSPAFGHLSSPPSAIFTVASPAVPTAPSPPLRSFSTSPPLIRIPTTAPPVRIPTTLPLPVRMLTNTTLPVRISSTSPPPLFVYAPNPNQRSYYNHGYQGSLPYNHYYSRRNRRY